MPRNHQDPLEAVERAKKWVVVANERQPRPRLVRRREQLRATIGPPSALDDTTRSETRDLLLRALATLSDKQRMIVTLFDVDGLTSSEIGERLVLAPGTVRWHLHEARRILRGALSSYFEG